jgi:hypothetical protein
MKLELHEVLALANQEAQRYNLYLFQLRHS